MERAPEEAIERLMEANQLDVALYEFAQQLFEDRYSQLVRRYGPSDAAFECVDASRRMELMLHKTMSRLALEADSLRPQPG